MCANTIDTVSEKMLAASSHDRNNHPESDHPYLWGPRTPGPRLFGTHLQRGRGLGQTLSAGSPIVGEPVPKILRSTYILAWGRTSRTPCHTARLRPHYGAATRRTQLPSWLQGWWSPQNHQCLTVYGVGGPHKNTAPSSSDHCVLAALPRLLAVSGCRLRSTAFWKMASGNTYPQSAR